MPDIITSTSNPRIKALAKLKDRAERDATGRFLIEGRRELAHALAGHIEFAELAVCEELLKEGGQETWSAFADAGVPVVALGLEAFRRVSYRQGPDGLIAVAKQFSTSLGEMRLVDGALVLIVEAIEKPGNLGAMIRTADAAGADAVIVADPVLDIFNPNVVRASQGSLFSVPLAVAPTSEVAGWAADHELHVVAADPQATVPTWQIDYRHSTAIVIGAEQSGLSRGWINRATMVSIPMHGAANSLNAAATAAILLYEALRQRHEG